MWLEKVFDLDRPSENPHWKRDMALEFLVLGFIIFTFGSAVMLGFTGNLLWLLGLVPLGIVTFCSLIIAIVDCSRHPGFN